MLVRELRAKLAKLKDDVEVQGALDLKFIIDLFGPKPKAAKAPRKKTKVFLPAKAWLAVAKSKGAARTVADIHGIAENTVHTIRAKYKAHGIPARFSKKEVGGE